MDVMAFDVPAAVDHSTQTVYSDPAGYAVLFDHVEPTIEAPCLRCRRPTVCPERPTSNGSRVHLPHCEAAPAMGRSIRGPADSGGRRRRVRRYALEAGEWHCAGSDTSGSRSTPSRFSRVWGSRRSSTPADCTEQEFGSLRCRGLVADRRMVGLMATNDEQIEATWMDTRLAVLEAIKRTAEEGLYGATNPLAEAYAWLTSSDQPHFHTR
jgi:hypothetical protein